jgi:hypothetical protein
MKKGGPFDPPKLLLLLMSRAGFEPAIPCLKGSISIRAYVYELPVERMDNIVPM